jgi:DNA-binding NarL/FixJ family response regulator
MAKLSSLMDASDMSGMGGTVGARAYTRIIPEWVKSREKASEVILRAFPKAKSDPAQRASAARWAVVIHLYFRMGYTRSQIAEEIGTTTEKIKGVIRSIYRVSEGRRADGRGLRKQHAPKLS